MNEEKEALLYDMASHIINADEKEPESWGAEGVDLLVKLRRVDPDKYDREVKKIGD